MEDIRVDENGDFRCWKCGGKNFTHKRTFRAKAIAVSTVAIAALATKKKLLCQACDTYNDVGSAKPWTGPADQPTAEQAGSVPAAKPQLPTNQKTCGVGTCQSIRLEGSEFCGRHGPR